MKKTTLVYIAAALAFSAGGTLVAVNAGAATSLTGDLGGGGGTGFEVPERTREPEPTRTRPPDTNPIPPEVPYDPEPSTIPVPERTRPPASPSPTRDGRNTPPVPDRCTVYQVCVTTGS
jgi:hypothetical protein